MGTSSEGNGSAAGFSDGNICPRFNHFERWLSCSTTDIHRGLASIFVCSKRWNVGHLFGTLDFTQRQLMFVSCTQI